MATKELYDRIVALENSTWRALQTSGTALVPFITDDCVMQFPLGVKVTRTSNPSVQDVLHSPAFVPWQSFEMDEVDVTPVGQDGAVISYRVCATRAPTAVEERSATFDALCCTVWRREKGEADFKMCFHQQSTTD